MQPETVKFPELWFLRMVSTGVDVMSLGPVVGMETGWNVVLHLEYLFPCLGTPCCLMQLVGWRVLRVAVSESFEEKVGAWKTLLFAP